MLATTGVRIVQIGDYGAVPITWLVIVLLLCGLAACILITVTMLLPMLVTLLTPQRREMKREDVATVMSWLVVPFFGGTLALGLVFGYIWQQTYRIRITPEGDWLLQNSLFVTIHRLPASTPRTVDLLTYTKMVGYTNVPGTYYKHLQFTVAAGQQRYRFTTLDGQAALTALGYFTLLPELDYPTSNITKVTRTPDGWLQFTAHQYGPDGPVWDASKTAASFRGGQHVFAWWKPDGWWYYAVVVAAHPGKIQVRYTDGSTETLPEAKVASLNIPAGAKVQAEWKKKDIFFPCTIKNTTGENLDLIYNDGTPGQVTYSNIRWKR